MKSIIFFSILLQVSALFFEIYLGAAPVISLFFVPYPDEDMVHEMAAVPSLNRPGKYARSILRGVLPSVQRVGGIVVSYGGFLEVSDYDGQISFPRKATSQDVSLLITESITPINMFKETIHHWEIDKQEAASLYDFHVEYDEPTQTTLWITKKIPLPPDGIIPLSTIIILARPDKIYVPLGATITPESQMNNIILPQLYVKYGIDSAKNASYALYIMHLFGPVSRLRKQGNSRYRSLLVT